MHYSKSTLLEELSDRIVLIRTTASGFTNLPENILSGKPGAENWSITEIFEHLNITHSIYIRSMISGMERAGEDNTDDYRSGWLGDWMYERTLPRPDGSVYKMRAPGFLQPPAELNAAAVFHDYFEQLDVVEKILQKAHRINLQKVRIPFSFAVLLKMRMGDCLRYIIAHHERHLLQASKAMNVMAISR